MSMILEMSLYAGIMVLVLAVIRKAALSRIPWQVMPWAWMAVLVRLLVPGRMVLTLPSDGTVGGIVGVEASALQQAASALLGHGGAVGAMDPVAQNIAATAAQPVSGWLILWVFGMAMVALTLLILRLGWHIRLRGSMQLPETEMIRAWRQRQPIRRRVRLYASAKVSSPFTCGLLRPRIYLPADMAEDTLLPVLVHEGTHIRRFHAALKGLALVALCLHWFNPLIWLMVRLMNRDIERSCDAQSMRLLGRAHRGTYAHALVALAVRGGGPVGVSTFAQHPVEERLRCLLAPSRKTLSGVLAAVLLCLLALGMFAGAEAATPSAIPEATMRVRWSSLDAGDAEEGQPMAASTFRKALGDAGIQVLLPEAQLPGYTALDEGVSVLSASTVPELSVIRYRAEGSADEEAQAALFIELSADAQDWQTVQEESKRLMMLDNGLLVMAAEWEGIGQSLVAVREDDLQALTEGKASAYPIYHMMGQSATLDDLLGVLAVMR